MEALTNTVQQSKARNKTALLCLDHLSTLLATVCTDPPSDHNDHHQTDWRFESDHVRRETLYLGILTKVVIALAGVGNIPPSAPVSGGGSDTGGAALLISIGNAALTASSILTRYTAPDCPPNSLKHSLKEEMITNDHFKIVKQLLEALRQIHNESGYPRQAKSHWSSCLKNVSILLSKVIALDTEALNYFRELNGFETLLACHKQTA
ncbi:hypothetical protein ADEAN_000181400 [Angomonas deanei]|uniref:Uncharacterized protein n=1 Tax=Angomonas deanei TaxID=59799 RepID=A0A7G2C443_9TRYP|nr:hypothetical protein ADEAN_000181400 [Angomonas deanei]